MHVQMHKSPPLSGSFLPRVHNNLMSFFLNSTGKLSQEKEMSSEIIRMPLNSSLEKASLELCEG